MRVVQMRNNGLDTKGSVEVNQFVEDEKEVKAGVANGGARGLSEENDSRNIQTRDGVNGVLGNSVQSQVEPEKLQQKPPGQVICWERFLPVRSLKVLLVENDDSTRHIVSALLRNCSYEVTAVSNGLQAWKVLEDMNNQIDLVLTEVVMPGLSGIGLLTKIMNHQTCKNIPIIMMSSHDSMGIVFKCLSKGAVDFLVKPIRKNELKNLWQHVWRKCHSSSGSGSESGVQNQKSTRSRSGEDSDNDSGSSEEYDDKGIDLLVCDGGDDGSGTQSSWTKKAVDAESPQQTSPWEQLSDPPDSTCAQVIHSRPEAFASSWVPIPAKENRELDDQLENEAMGKNLELGAPRNQDSLQDNVDKTLLDGIVTNKDHYKPVDSKNDDKKFDNVTNQVVSGKPKGDRVEQAADVHGFVVSNCDPHRVVIEPELPSVVAESSKIEDKPGKNSNNLPSLELTLKRRDDGGDVRPTVPDPNALRHSVLSAFTRYRAGSAANNTPTGNVGSCSPVDNSSDAAKTDSPPNLRSSSNGTPLNQVSNSSSNNNDMGSTTYRSSTKPTEVIDKPSAKTTSTVIDCANPSVKQPVEGGRQSVTQNDKTNVGSALVRTGCMGQEVQVQHHYHHYHHHHHHVHCLKQLNQIQNDDSSCPNKVTALQCGSSNAAKTPIEVNVANCSINGSASGSNHGSNLHNGSSTAANAEGTNIASDNWGAVKCEGGDGSGSGSGTGTGGDQNRYAQREAVLNKFRQKRKERCFEKRVRYQSRKKLAEQRPRVRGQFVRQVQESKSEDADS